MSISCSNNLIIGIDVSKSKLDICFGRDMKKASILNNEDSINGFVQKLPDEYRAGMVVMESTGGHEKLAHKLLAKANIAVHIAHPTRIFYFAKQKGCFAKTDAIDAKIIAEYGLQGNLIASPIATEDKENLKELASRRTQLVELITAEKCRLKSNFGPQVTESIRRTIQFFESEIERIEHAMYAIIQNDADLAKKLQIITSFTGIGKMTASVLIGLLPELGIINRSKIACLAGLAPKNNDSGTRRGKRMISGGRFYVRKALYMPAMASIQHNKEMGDFFNRLVETGRPKKIAITAVMRKMLITINAMVRDDKEWRKPYQTTV